MTTIPIIDEADAVKADQKVYLATANDAIADALQVAIEARRQASNGESAKAFHTISQCVARLSALHIKIENDMRKI